MRKRSSILNIICLTSILGTSQVFAKELFTNNVKEITFNRNTSGKTEVILTMNKIDNTVRVIKKDDLEYVILIPETSNTVTKSPSLEMVSELVNDVEIKTQPYVGNIKGYTKITIKTSKPMIMSAKSVLETPVISQEEIEKVKHQDRELQAKEKLKEEKKLEAQLKKEQKEKSKKQNVSKPANPITEETTQQSEITVQETPKNTETTPTNTTETKETKPQEVNETTTTTTTETVEEQVQDQDQTQEQLQEPEQELTLEPIAEPVKKKPDLKTKSLYTSVGISGVLLLLLLLLKLYNNSKKNKKENIPSTDSSIQNTVNETSEEEPEVVLNYSTENIEMPVHEFHENHISDQPESENIDEQLLNEVQPVVDEQLLDEVQPVVDEQLLDEVQPVVDEQLLDEVQPVVDEQLLDEVQPVVDEQLLDEVQPVVDEQLLDEVQPVVDEQLLDEVQPVVDEQLLDEVQPVVDEQLLDEVQPVVDEQLTDEVQPVVDEQLLDEVQPVVEKQRNYHVISDPIIKTETQYQKIFIPVEPIKEDNIDNFNNDFDNNATPDNVFGQCEDELTSVREELINKENNKEKTLINRIPAYKYFDFLENLNLSEETGLETNLDLNEDAEENTDNNLISTENNISVDNSNNKESNISNDNYNDIIKSSYSFTQLKSIYLVDYENVSILMASIKDNYIILKKFDSIIDKPLVVRQTEKTGKKSTYLVRAGSYRCILDVTMKNIEMVLEL